MMTSGWSRVTTSPADRPGRVRLLAAGIGAGPLSVGTSGQFGHRGAEGPDGIGIVVYATILGGYFLHGFATSVDRSPVMDTRRDSPQQRRS
jgi:hypothetical protein